MAFEILAFREERGDERRSALCQIGFDAGHQLFVLDHHRLVEPGKEGPLLDGQHKHLRSALGRAFDRRISDGVFQLKSGIA